MKSILLICGILLVPTCGRGASWFVRPEIAYFEPRSKGADTTVAAFAAVGAAWGSAGENELELEVGWAAWDEHEESVDPFEPFIAGSDKQLVPMLVNYRRQFRVSEGMHAYLEAGVGLSLVSVEWENTTPWGSSQGSHDEVGGALSTGAGFRWNLSERAALHAGLRYVAAVVPRELDLDDTTVDDASVTAFTLEVGVRFAW